MSINLNLEAAVLTIVAIEEFLRLETEYLENLLHSNLFRKNDEKMNVILEVNFPKLGLKNSSDLTFGQLIKRYLALTKDNPICVELDQVNHMRKKLVHKLFENENIKYIKDEENLLKDFVILSRAAAIRLHTSVDKITKDLSDNLIRSISGDIEEAE